MRDFLSRHLFSPLQGMTLGVWLASLRRSGFAVDPPYWARGAFQTANSVGNSVVAAIEERRHGAAVDAVAVEPPLFILGHWRHGTTHLHNLLALDPRPPPPTLYPTPHPPTLPTT